MVNSACDNCDENYSNNKLTIHSPIEGKEAIEVKLNVFDELSPWKLTNTRDRGIEETVSGSRKRSLVLLVRRVHV